MLTELIEIITSDKVRLGALHFTPTHGKCWGTAVWFSGLMSSTMSRAGRIKKLAKLFTARGFGLMCVDHRGAGVITGLKQGSSSSRSKTFGTAYENFTDSVYDIGAAVNYLRAQGEKNIFLLGHSTGANKLAYFIQKTGARWVRGVGLLGALSDVPGWQTRLGSKYKLTLTYAKKMISQGRGHELMPSSLVCGEWWTALRFVSLATVGATEDVFPYYRQRAKFPWVKKVALPVSMIIGEKDQFLDRPAKELVDSFMAQVPAKYFSSFIIPGADHSFYGQEVALVTKLCGWMKGIVRIKK